MGVLAPSWRNEAGWTRERRCGAVRGAETKQRSIHRQTSSLGAVRLLDLFMVENKTFFINSIFNQKPIGIFPSQYNKHRCPPEHEGCRIIIVIILV